MGIPFHTLVYKHASPILLNLFKILFRFNYRQETGDLQIKMLFLIVFIARSMLLCKAGFKMRKKGLLK